MEYVKASRFALPELTRLWNASYTGYFIPIKFTEQMLANWFRCGDIDLDNSLVVLDGETPAGISLLGVRGDRGWIGGFGVTPDYRGQGLAYRFFAAHAALWSTLPLRTVQLEVLTENWARKVYERAGFAVARRLTMLSGKLPAGEGGYAAADVHEAAPVEVLAFSDRLHAGCSAVWQREPGWLGKALPEGARAIWTGPATAPAGFAIYAVNGENLRLFDAAAADGPTAQELVALLGALHVGKSLTVVNEPEVGHIHAALTAAGCTEVRAQYDMLWQRG